jgi:hypothetical protein
MKNFLTEAERAELKQRHRREKDRRTADRIKAVLLSDAGWRIWDFPKAVRPSRRCRIFCGEFR